MLSPAEEKIVIAWAEKEAEKWRKRKIAELNERIKTGGKLTSMERSILAIWAHYGRRIDR